MIQRTLGIDTKKGSTPWPNLLLTLNLIPWKTWCKSTAFLWICKRLCLIFMFYNMFFDIYQDRMWLLFIFRRSCYYHLYLIWWKFSRYRYKKRVNALTQPLLTLNLIPWKTWCKSTALFPNCKKYSSFYQGNSIFLI